MKKLSSTTVYQLSVSDLKEAIASYMESKHQLRLNISTIEDVQKSTGSFGYDDGFDVFDGVKVYVEN